MVDQFKNLSFSLFNKFLSHPTSEDTLEQIFRRNNVTVPKLDNLPNPYYPVEIPYDDPCLRDDIIFITSRFRSGSTLLWNLFRNIEGCTAYYEPFNERRWFDAKQRGSHVDETHLGVSDYWLEYQGMEDLGEYYNEDWIRKDLMMDEQSWQPSMKKYIEELIIRAKGRPVFQFNRIDFRLPWFKKHFPNAKIIHLYRNPRDQFCSFITDKKLMNKDNVQDTYKDAFYLDIWCEDLKKFYPFLDKKHSPHPYQRFYYLWKLSFLHGQRFADYSLSLEELINNSDNTIREIYGKCNWPIPQDLTSLTSIIAENSSRWEGYAKDEWFRTLELKCEILLSTLDKEQQI